MTLTPAHVVAVQEAADDEVLDLTRHGFSLSDAISRLLISFEDSRMYFVQTAPNPEFAEEYRLALDHLRRKRLGIQ